MVKHNDLNAQNFLDRNEEIPFEQLSNYVGSAGKYTPLVKWIEVALDKHDLEGLEIIDTPGLNDPIVSRTIQTSQFLEKCDVVFLLSYTGQFLSADDMTLLQKTLPHNGIRNAVLVGSKFDSVILDQRNMPFGQVLRETAAELRDYSKQVLTRSDTPSNGISEAIRKMKSENPYFISSLLFAVAGKIQKGINLSAEEKHIIENLCRFSGFRKDDVKFLLDVSGIGEIKKKLASVRQDKDKIIAEKIASLFRDNQGKYIDLLERINIDARRHKMQLETVDVSELEQKLKFYNTALNSIRDKVKNCLDLQVPKAAKVVKHIQLCIEINMQEHKDFVVDEKTGIYVTGFFCKKTETITTRRASVTDAVQNLHGFANEAKRYVAEEIEQIFDKQAIKHELKDIILKGFDTSNPDFDENDIITPVEILLEQLTIPIEKRRLIC
ncbi:MAG: dynamin family protein [Planctomycetaceae bacterium]|nr:dynamin family protein [Planctomycetaceae bacterium]